MSARAHVLYRMYDADGALLYIGITCNPSRRFERHYADKPWYADVAHIALEHFPDRPSVLLAERRAIAEERPLHNVRLQDTPLPAVAAICDEWIDDTDEWCGAPASYLASPTVNGGIYVCSKHATAYTLLEELA